MARVLAVLNDGLNGSNKVRIVRRVVGGAIQRRCEVVAEILDGVDATGAERWVPLKPEKVQMAELGQPARWFDPIGPILCLVSDLVPRTAEDDPIEGAEPTQQATATAPVFSPLAVEVAEAVVAKLAEGVPVRIADCLERAGLPRSGPPGSGNQRMPHALRVEALELSQPVPATIALRNMPVPMRSRLANVCWQFANLIEQADRCVSPDRSSLVRASGRSVLGALHVAALTHQIGLSDEDTENLAVAAEHALEDARAAV